MLSSLKLRETFCSTQNVLPCSYVHDYVGLMRAVCPAPSIPSSKAFVTTGDHSFIYYSHCQFKLVRQVGKIGNVQCLCLPTTNTRRLMAVRSLPPKNSRTGGKNRHRASDQHTPRVLASLEHPLSTFNVRMNIPEVEPTLRVCCCLSESQCCEYSYTHTQ